MMKHALAAAAVALVAAPAFSDEVRTVHPIEATTLSAGGVDMVAYFVPTGDDLYEVTATWTDGGAPRRLILSLDDGDSVSFAVPGHTDTLYTFSRNSAALTISNRPSEELRSASL